MLFYDNFVRCSTVPFFEDLIQGYKMFANLQMSDIILMHKNVMFSWNSEKS